MATHDLVHSEDVEAARVRLEGFGPLLARVFPELAPSGGIIESPLVAVPKLGKALGLDPEDFGSLFLKCDHDLPIAGSVKARGGVFEVISFAQDLATGEGILNDDKGIEVLADSPARELFGGWTIVVGSTGNLGLSVGIAATALGFNAVVHMSSDAKAWKKDLLRSRGVTVVEHEADYSNAVATARAEALNAEHRYFVDDEQSKTLFLGYAVAAWRLKLQLESLKFHIGPDQPLFLYLPCGIGGAPGGIAYGANCLFGEHAHAFLAEPVASACMMLRLMDPSSTRRSVYDIGLDNRTEADGLAVGRASDFVADVVRPFIGGAFTVEDESLFRWLTMVNDLEGHRVEPSATAGFAGPRYLTSTDNGQAYLRQAGVAETMKSAVHVLWSTGGALVPDEEYRRFYERGSERVA